MRLMLRCTCIAILLLISANQLSAQSNKPQLYAGIGTGFDYGGFGGKIEFLPEEHIGIFGGLGYNFLSAGWNVGATYKILPQNNISPNIMAMYGYNAAFKGSDNYTAQYNMTSYGLTIGADLDIKTGINGNKLSVGILVPIRSGEFMDNYHAVKNDPNVDLKTILLPIGFKIGYNIAVFH